MVHPCLCWLGIALSFGVSLALFTSDLLDVHEYYYVPVLLLIGFYTAHAILTDRQQYQSRTIRQVIPKAIAKYIMWGLIIYGVKEFYAAHPLYGPVQGPDGILKTDFSLNTRRFLGDFLTLFLIVGLPYFFLAEKFRYCTDNILGDPYLRILSLLKCLKNREFRLIGRRLCKRSYKRIYLMAIIRVHYIPIMIEQVFRNLKSVTGFLQGANFQWNLASSVLVATTLAWAIDANNGALGYFWESWFTKSRFRQIDMNPLHWFVVLICYAPFVGLAGQFVPLPQVAADSAPLLSSSSFNSAIEVVLLISLVLYVLSGSTLNFSTSNLCYKKIQTKGPYAIVRHPATTCKLLFFFLAFFRYRAAFTFVGILCYSIWLTVYICRALVEESFLKKFPDYRNYMKKTRYRFIPRVC
jgi:protein-S-isoprenylcysteine O-methyltransferase Ste14